jgi:hypothetical protein
MTRHHPSMPATTNALCARGGPRFTFRATASYRSGVLVTGGSAGPDAVAAVRNGPTSSRPRTARHPLRGNGFPDALRV